jgi:mannose-6-phosphate isomerase class I
LVRHELFHIHHLRLPAATSMSVKPMQQGPVVLAVTAGSLELIGDFETVPIRAGGFCLLPAVLPAVEVRAVGTAEFLRVAPLQR